MSRLVKWLWSLITNITQAWQLLAAFIPAGVVTAMTGYLASAWDVPSYLVILYSLGALCLASLSAMAFFQARLRLVEFRYATTAQGKLDYVGPHLAADIDWDKAKARHFQRINLGFQLRNSALFGIAYRIEEFHATIEGRAANTDKLVNGQTHIAIAGAFAASYPEPIDINDLRKSQVSGRFDLKIVYGLPGGKLEYEINKKMDIDLYLNTQASVRPNAAIAVAVRERISVSQQTA